MLPGEERIPALVPRQAHHGVLLVQGADHVGFETLLVGDEEAYFHVAFLCLRWMVGRLPYRKAPDVAMLAEASGPRRGKRKCGVVRAIAGCEKTFFIR